MHRHTSLRAGTRRVTRHLRHNVIGYVALLVALSLTPIPGWAAATIGTADLQDSAVTARKLARNAVRSPKIKNGTVRKVDLAPRARGFSAVVVKRTTQTFVDPGAELTFDVMCPPSAT
jgi:hypothetical protein